MCVCVCVCVSFPFKVSISIMCLMSVTLIHSLTLENIVSNQDLNWNT